jgi:hypothetical protein
MSVPDTAIEIIRSSPTPSISRSRARAGAVKEVMQQYTMRHISSQVDKLNREKKFDYFIRPQFIGPVNFFHRPIYGKHTQKFYGKWKKIP